MSSQFKIYKIFSGQSSIYVEFHETPFPLDLELYLGACLVDSVCNISANHIFKVSTPGEYSVIAKNNSSLLLKSNKLCFFNSEIHSGLSEVIDAVNFDIDEPGIDNVDQFYIEIKSIRNCSKQIDEKLEGGAIANTFKKRHINLNTFHEEHPIHNYEYYRTSNTLKRDDAKYICKLIDEINGVVYCSIVPVTDDLPPPKLNAMENPKSGSNNISDTPDFSELQGYLDDPHGMNVRKAWLRGYSGELVAIRHLDYGIYKNHEDFQGGNITVVNSRDETKDCNHGTASTGCIAASNNGFGVTGIAYSSSYYFYDTGDKDKILEHANPGDIVSLNIQFTSNGINIPAIGIKSWWDTIYNLTEKGAIVIVAAGNSGSDIGNTSICPDYGDSGAMVVGACNSSTGRRLSFSNYGHYSSLINSWGHYVTTTGYSSLQNLEGHERDYNSTYSGTSSATPLCSGALALLQCYAKKHDFILTAKGMRQLLSNSDYIEAVDDLIGKRPNVDYLFYFIENLLPPPVNDGIAVAHKWGIVGQWYSELLVEVVNNSGNTLENPVVKIELGQSATATQNSGFKFSQTGMFLTGVLEPHLQTIQNGASVTFSIGLNYNGDFNGDFPVAYWVDGMLVQGKGKNSENIIQ